MFDKRSKAFSSTLCVVLATVMAWGPVASAAEPFLGEIIIFAGNFAPRNWALCDGQLLAINQNQSLFSILGTTYGGDGRTTFALPDMRGRVPIHAGSGPGLTPRSLGEKSGQETVALNSNQMPQHKHMAQGYSGRGNEEGPGNTVWAKKSRDDDYSSNAPDVQMNANAISNTGGNQAHNNMPPFIAVNYIIAVQGTFPPRN
jgi:microcystin-dependent protein